MNNLAVKLYLLHNVLLSFCLYTSLYISSGSMKTSLKYLTVLSFLFTSTAIFPVASFAAKGSQEGDLERLAPMQMTDETEYDVEIEAEMMSEAAADLEEDLNADMLDDHTAEENFEISETSGEIEMDTGTLASIVGAGLESNPEFAAIRANYLATVEEKKQARALYLPSVDVSADTGVEYSDDQSTRAGNDGADTETLSRYDTSLTVTQLLFDGGETKYENKRQLSRVKSAKFRVQEAGELIGLSIVEAYLSVMRQRKLMEISKKNIEDHESFYRQIEDSTRAGRSSLANLEQAKARVASAKAQMADVQQNLRFAEASFIREVGFAPSELTLPSLPSDVSDLLLDDHVGYALDNSPTLMISEADIDVSQAEKDGAYAPFYPQFDLQLTAREGKDLGGVRGRDTSASALVTMDWNLYRGGGDVARLREFERREMQAKEQKNDARRQLRNDIHDTWAQKQAASQRKQMFEMQFDANSQLVKAYFDQFELGRRTLLDLLDTQNELFVSHSNLVNSQFLELFASYRLLALRGDLLSTLNLNQLITDKL